MRRPTRPYDPRTLIVEIARRMNATGLTEGASGNVSLRAPGGFLVTPSGLRYDELEPRQIVEVGLDGRVAPRQLAPSSEWAIHRDLYARRPEVAAVVHAHPPFATALACARRGLPAFHYMVAAAGGRDIRCAEYATFGTPELSASVATALEGRRACLMANHGIVAVGASLQAAFELASLVEELAAQYLRALQAGGPVLLSDEEMDRVLARFESYGQPGRR
jgi:L-fuculose-phosphate aldolase